MKKIIMLILGIFIILLLGDIQVISRSEFKAPPGHHWSTPNGKDRQDGIPRSKATQSEDGRVSIGGGCEDHSGTCWELAENGTLLIIYDLVIHPGPGEDLIFVPVPDSIPPGGGN